VTLFLVVALSLAIGRRSDGGPGVSPTPTIALTNFNGRSSCVTCR
jgi:hypothetical protein